MLKKAKGYRGRRSKLFRYAKDAVMKAQYWAYRDRKTRKRTFRYLWIQRLNAAARANGMTYSRLAEGLKAAGIGLDRKILADLAVTDEAAFKSIVDQAQIRAGGEKQKGGVISLNRNSRFACKSSRSIACLQFVDVNVSTIHATSA